MNQSLSNHSYTHRLTILLFALTIFFSAFLLFQVQPIMGKYILPWYGGSPGVWTTCLLVFQVLLFGGYAYAFALNRFLKLRMQIALHCSLLLLATVTLPITPTSEWKPTGIESPTWMIMLLLLCKIGAPYFLLSSTGPLLQSWLGQSKILEQPYRLYSLSNVGSMLALLSFPFAIEPALSSSEQSSIWSICFAVFAVACSLSGFALFYSRKQTQVVAEVAVETESKPIAGTRIATWFGLAMLPSVMLLATTNQVCLDAGVIPFLWVIPLAIYLLSFILTFDSERWYSRRPCIMMATVSFLILFFLKLIAYQTPLLVELTLYFSGLLFACMVCHGELVSIKPHAKKLTLFYMTMSAGGAFGGIFVGLLSPLLFTGYFEWQLSLFVCVLVFLDIYLQSNSFWANRVPAKYKLMGAFALPVLAVIWLSAWTSFSNNTIVAKRNFYGVLSVANSRDPKSGKPTRNMVHGRIIHGSQFQEPEFQQNPSTYFTPSAGIGITLLNHKADRPRHIGVVGLGAGVLATYGKSGDRIRYYEINDDVVQLAKEYFTFLSETPASVDVILGDARLALEREEAQSFDVLVLDAFTGDAIPVHLLTKEAMQIYQRHLKRDGVLAIHISNLYFDLKSIVRGLAHDASFEVAILSDEQANYPGALKSCWAILASKTETLDLAIGVSKQRVPAGKQVLWTDDKSNLFETLR
jgi:SAM-dependent methyltransferase